MSLLRPISFRIKANAVQVYFYIFSMINDLKSAGYKLCPFKTGLSKWSVLERTTPSLSPCSSMSVFLL